MNISRKKGNKFQKEKIIKKRKYSSGFWLVSG